MNNLTDIVFQLKIWQSDLISDLVSDWVPEESKAEMQIQLIMLNSSIANLEAILADEQGQIFFSTIQRTS